MSKRQTGDFAINVELLWLKKHASVLSVVTKFRNPRYHPTIMLFTLIPDQSDTRPDQRAISYETRANRRMLSPEL